jgi:hypothetical protein
VTRQKKAGFVVRVFQPHNPPIPLESDVLVVRAVIGSMNLNRGIFSGRGVEGSTDTPSNLTYKASLLTP